MPIYEDIQIQKTESRALVNQSELNLRFNLREEFCAAWQALEKPIEVVCVATNQPEPLTHSNGPLRQVHLTAPLLECFSNIAVDAVKQEAKRLGESYPEELYKSENLERLVAGCINHGNGAVAVRYQKKTGFDY